MPAPLPTRLGFDYPVIQAPIGSASCPALAAAVSDAGGLGMLALSWRSPAEARAKIRATRQLTQRPFGINLVLAWDMRERLEAALDEGVGIVSLAWGDPTPFTSIAHRAGAFVIQTVGSAEEAVRAKDSGVDAVVAQGWESGGHVLGEVAMSVLVPAVCDAVGPLPVIAAGGIADGRGIAAALALGAEAVWIGTRFLATPEAHVHPSYRARVLAARETDTVFSSLFDKGWPDAPHRTMRNSTVRAWEVAGRPDRPNRPGEDDVVARGEDGRPIVRYEDAIPLPGTTGDCEALALYAGQSAALVGEVVPARELVARLMRETTEALDRARGPGYHLHTPTR